MEQANPFIVLSILLVLLAVCLVLADWVKSRAEQRRPRGFDVLPALPPEDRDRGEEG